MSDWRENMRAALAVRGCSSQAEWVAKFPGEHCWFDFKGIDSCALCGVCRPYDDKKAGRCRGIVRIELRKDGGSE